MTPNEYTEKLDIKIVEVEAGDYKTASEYTIRIGGHSFPYTQGCGHRRVKKSATLPTPRKMFKAYQRGEQVPHVYGGVTLYLEQFLLTETEPTPPDATDVLACLVSDWQCVEFSSFNDFCDELGYNSDSRKDYKTFESCQAIASALRASGLVFNEACEVFQDY